MPWPWSFPLFRRRRAAKVDARGATAEADTYVVLGGRRIRVDSPYMLPKDLGESNRLDLQHYLLRYVLNGNVVAPIGQPQSILDVGCGTGRWGADMARQFPQANVVGVDIAPPTAESAAVLQGQDRPPDNYTFVTGDVTKGLAFADNSFDFVHMRLVVMALPQSAWAPAIAELYRVTKPGGWIELVDTTVTARSPQSRRWVAWAQAMARMRGIDLTAGARIGEFLRGAGLRDVQETALELPLGPWGGRVGNLMLADAIAGAQALEKPVVDMAHLATRDEFNTTVAGMAQDFRTLPNCTQPFYIAYGRK